jgi:hypothetical protein
MYGSQNVFSNHGPFSKEHCAAPPILSSEALHVAAALLLVKNGKSQQPGS